MESLKFVMTTTFYPPYHIGGDAVHVYHLSNELAKRGHEVHVIHLLDSYLLKKSKPSGVFDNDKGVIVHSIKSPIGRLSPVLSYITGRYIPLESKILNLIKEISPDVLHHHNIAGFGPFILKAKAPKVLYTAHDYWIICPQNTLSKKNGHLCKENFSCSICSLFHKRPVQLWRLNMPINNLLRDVDAIITPSYFVKNKFREFGINKKIKVIPNFIPAVGSETDFCSKLFSYPYVLYVGVLEKHKGVIKLIKVFHEIENEINCKLIIVGEGSLFNEIKKNIEKFNSNNIILKGWISENQLYSLYREARSVVIPSEWSENNPLVALEALSFGTPVMVSNNGGLPEIARKIKIPAFDSEEELKNLLLKIDKNEIEFEDPYSIYKQNYSPSGFISKYLSLIFGGT